MEKRELQKLVRAALELMRPVKRADIFTLADIAGTIQNKCGVQLDADDLDDIREIMISLWGSGVEPVGIGASLLNSAPWKFGRGKPPVSQEIRTR